LIALGSEPLNRAEETSPHIRRRKKKKKEEEEVRIKLEDIYKQWKLTNHIKTSKAMKREREREQDEGEEGT
jgi:polyphosphate kinase